MADLRQLIAHTDSLIKRAGGLHPPAAVALNWPRPNYVNPETRGWEAPIVLLVFLGITTLVYLARMWARLAVSKNAGLDDILISVSMIPLLGLTVSVVLAATKYGFQWHAWDQTAKTMVTTRQITMSIELNYMLSTTLIKVSILCFYRRITGSLKNYLVYWVWGTMAFCIGYGILFTFLIIFTCTPVVGFFHIFDVAWLIKNPVHCRDEGAIIVACAVISSVQDLIICVLPMALVWQLQISSRQKIALCGIFGMGMVTCVCGIMRTYYATYVYYFTYDITWVAYHGWIWTVLEAQLAVICASAPAIKVFFKRYFALTSSRAGYTGTDSRKTPLGSSPRSRGYHQQSHLSTTRSHVVGRGAHDSEVPLEGIKISQGLDISIEERDDISQKSFASTRNLTTLPSEPSKVKAGWGAVRALKPGSRSQSRSASREKDIERGPE